MDQASQIEIINRMFHYMETKTTAMSDAVYRNNVSDYTNEEQLAEEQEILFHQHPIMMGLSCELPNPGDYMTTELPSTSVLIVRAESGNLNAFMNVCRHRGARVAKGCGTNKRRFSCPYHAWTYDCEGRLVNIPGDKGFEEIDRKQHGLRSLPIVEKYGMIWIKGEPGNAFDIDDSLSGLATDLSSFQLDGYHHFETCILKQRMNWKLVVDTFLETYHISTLHSKTLTPILHNNIGAHDRYGLHQRGIFPRKTFDEMRQIEKNDWDLIKHTVIVYTLFPNTVFIMQGDHVETWRIFPSENSPDQALMYVSLYTPEKAETEKAKQHWDANMKLLLDVVRDEDFPLGENIQRNFRSGTQKHINFGLNEPGLAHYHASIKQALGIVNNA